MKSKWIGFKLLQRDSSIREYLTLIQDLVIDFKFQTIDEQFYNQDQMLMKRKESEKQEPKLKKIQIYLLNQLKKEVNVLLVKKEGIQENLQEDKCKSNLKMLHLHQRLGN
ncbi:unnamed protein product [Paramecium sonneborni]|uniref:Uncharacterized protein n=1 Tax=Paramecium sonneborni TaxID=65129 RepID=A0A8S1JVS1_9CILI|nr:unnamed protein product [Paramecium sonneborni]